MTLLNHQNLITENLFQNFFINKKLVNILEIIKKPMF